METFEMVGPPGRVAIAINEVKTYLRRGYSFRPGEEDRYKTSLSGQGTEEVPQPMRRSRRTEFRERSES